MSMCDHTARGPHAAMRGTAANDNAPAEAVATEAGVWSVANRVVRLWTNRKRARDERRRQPEAAPPDYDDVLAIVRAEMGRPSA